MKRTRHKYGERRVHTEKYLNTGKGELDPALLGITYGGKVKRDGANRPELLTVVG